MDHVAEHDTTTDTADAADEGGHSRMGRDLQRLLAIRDCCRSFLLGELRFGLLLDGVEAWAGFEQLSPRWTDEFTPHLDVFYAAFERADRNRTPLPTRDDRAVADAASAMISMISRLLGDDVPLALPTYATPTVPTTTAGIAPPDVVDTSGGEGPGPAGVSR